MPGIPIKCKTTCCHGNLDGDFSIWRHAIVGMNWSSQGCTFRFTFIFNERILTLHCSFSSKSILFIPLESKGSLWKDSATQNHDECIFLWCEQATIAVLQKTLGMSNTQAASELRQICTCYKIGYIDIFTKRGGNKINKQNTNTPTHDKQLNTCDTIQLRTYPCVEENKTLRDCHWLSFGFTYPVHDSRLLSLPRPSSRQT